MCRSPDWTVLPPLELRGVGSPLVESLEHYLARLSVACATTPRRLAFQVWIASGRKSPARKKRWEFNDSLQCSPSFNSALTDLTGVAHIARGSWQPLSEVLRPGWMGYSDFRRWCPLCYLNWDHDSSVEPLVWNVAILSRCSIHRCSLVTRCRQCGSSQPRRREYRLRRTCSSCLSPLAYQPAHVPESPIERWIDDVVHEVVDICADPTVDSVPSANLAALIQGISDVQWMHGRSPAFARFRTGLLKRSERTISMSDLVNLCAFQSARPRELLLAPVEASSPPLFRRLPVFDELPILTARGQRAAVRHADVLRLLAAEDNRPLLPLSIVAKHLGSDEKRLAVQRPELVDLYRAALSLQCSWPASELVKRCSQSAIHLLKSRETLVEPSTRGELAQHLSAVHGASPQLCERILGAAWHLLEVEAKAGASHASKHKTFCKASWG